METQLSLDTYAAWVAIEAKWRLTPDEQKLLKDSYDYTRRDRVREMPDDMKYVRNTKAREYRRVSTFEKYIAELDRQKAKNRNVGGASVRVKAGDNPIQTLMRARLHGCYKRAHARGLAFDLDLDFLVELAEQSTACPCCKTELSYVGENTNAQLDKHIPSLGYVKTNVNFLCEECNRLKSNHSVETLQRVLNYMMG